MLVVCVLTVITLSCLFVRVCCCCVMLVLFSIIISVLTKRDVEDMYKLEHERDVCVMKTELQETKNKNRDLQKRVKALYKEIRRLSDSLLPQERAMDCLRKEKEDLRKENQHYRDSMTDLILKLPNVCKVSYTKRDDGKTVLDLKPFD